MGYKKNENFKPVLNTAKQLLIELGESNIADILNSSTVNVSQTYHDSWNGGVDYYTVYIDVSVSDFASNQSQINSFEQKILDSLNTVIRNTESEVFSQVIISPSQTMSVEWSLLNIPKQELIDGVEFLNNTMVSVATGGQIIKEADPEYKRIYIKVNSALNSIGVENPNKYRNLWDWHGKWKRDFTSYQERRDYINKLYEPIYEILSEDYEYKIVDVSINLSGWDKIKFAITEIKKRERAASRVEQFQAVGTLCRELIITLAQTVYKEEEHPSVDGVEISNTDANRMLESYIKSVLKGGAHEELRSYAKSTNKLANAVTHKRSSTKKDMMMCTSATLTLVNFVGILENKL